MRYKHIMCNWNLILLSLKNKPLLLKIMLAISKKLRKNKIFSLILWMRKANGWKNKKISSLLKLSPRRSRLNKPRKFSMKLSHKWRKWSAARKDYYNDGKNPSWWCKKEIPPSKQPVKDATAKNKPTPFSSMNSQASEAKSAKKKNSPKN